MNRLMDISQNVFDQYLHNTFAELPLLVLLSKSSVTCYESTAVGPN